MVILLKLYLTQKFDVNNSPKHSNYTKENNYNVLDSFKRLLSYFSFSEISITAGDVNSRIENQPDSINEREKDLNYLPEGYELNFAMPPRNNKDPSINKQG